MKLTLKNKQDSVRASGHIQNVSKVMEVCREQRLSLVLTFVVYEKAFHSVETDAVLSVLVDQGIERNREKNRIANKPKEEFIKNVYCMDGGVQLEDYHIVKTSSNVYLGRRMKNDMKEELNGRMRGAWAAFSPVREATDQLTDQYHRVHLFDSTVLPALPYAAEAPQAPHATTLNNRIMEGLYLPLRRSKESLDLEFCKIASTFSEPSRGRKEDSRELAAKHDSTYLDEQG
ncbi:hypothetical protein RB195_024913 [Necator americanus]|uniref:Reverse transcriptase domain-containing protein n=1 Tax=Necator americanus TaxID=51031 RepID=A0ABR1EQC5_NECAM